METGKEYLKNRLKHATQIKKIRGEASTRSFYRIQFPNYTLIAMVYPAENPDEISKITRLTRLYLQHHIHVPEIKEIIDNRVILQQDLGDLLAQKAFFLFKAGDREKIITSVADILVHVKGIPTSNTAAVHDTARMKWEMDFFYTHFAKNYLRSALSPGHAGEFQERLHRMVEQIHPIDTFAHRDFHSRNMLIHEDRLYLVDFQDSLVASPYYDLVSFAFDCYLDLKSHRQTLLALLKTRGITVDDDLYYTAALQRNIKALGTFGYQVTVRKNLAYKKYIPRTLRHIAANPRFGTFFQSEDFALAGKGASQKGPIPVDLKR